MDKRKVMDAVDFVNNIDYDNPDTLVYGISRTEEASLPEFTSHMEAREYLKKHYGDWNIQLVDSFESDGEKIFFYHYILDPDIYLEYVSLPRKQQIMDPDSKYLYSFQNFSISESGLIHFEH